MKFLMILFLLISCTAIQSTKNQAQVDPWYLLENFNSLSIKEITSYLGEPDKILKEQSGNSLWVYYDSITQRQSWTASISDVNQKVLNLAYFPPSSSKGWLTSDVEIRWRNKGCRHIKKENLIAGHNQSTERILKCDNDKKIVKYNRYGEVSGISVE